MLPMDAVRLLDEIRVEPPDLAERATVHVDDHAVQDRPVLDGLRVDGPVIQGRRGAFENLRRQGTLLSDLDWKPRTGPGWRAGGEPEARPLALKARACWRSSSV